MRKLARSLIVVLPAFLAGLVAWLFLPCQPERSVLVPAGTKLVEFSRAGRYVVTFQREERRLTLWRTDTGQASFGAEIPCAIPSSATNGVKAFYGFSADDRRLAIATGRPDDPYLVIVELTSANIRTPIAEFPRGPLAEFPGSGDPDSSVNVLGRPPDKCGPRPAFSSDGRYLSYFNVDSLGGGCAVLYDLAEKRERLRVPGVFDSLGPPTNQGKWLIVNWASGIEVWDVLQKRREAILPVWPPGWSMLSESLSPDEQGVTALCFVFSPFPKEHIVSYRCDLTTRKIETEWEYALPLSAQPPLWNTASSGPYQFLLIKTRDDIGHLVQDLLDVATGELLARYPEPIDMLEGVNVLSRSVRVTGPPGLTRSLGRTGQIAIDSEHRVIVSKQISRDSFFWDHFGTPLGWLGIRPGPPRLGLQFHSAETGRLLQRVPLQTSDFSQGEPRLALHPSQPLLAVIDEDGSNSRLQFWRLPPPKPWAWIAACGLAAAACSSLAWIAHSKARKRKSESTTTANSRFPTCIFCLVCYLMAGMAVSFEMLPAEGFAIFGIKVEGNTLSITMWMAGIFLLLGIVLHVLFYRLNRERFDVRAFWKVGIAMVSLYAALIVLSIILSRTTGLPPSVLSQRFEAVMNLIGVSVIGGVVLLLASIFIWLFLYFKFHPGNRMARRMKAGDFAGAIRIGERRQVEKRAFLTNINLVSAYAQSGQKEKAKQLLALLEQTQGVPKYFTQESFKLSLDHLRRLIEPEGSTGSLTTPTA